MKQLDTYIFEKLVINKDTKDDSYFDDSLDNYLIMVCDDSKIVNNLLSKKLDKYTFYGVKYVYTIAPIDIAKKYINNEKIYFFTSGGYKTVQELVDTIESENDLDFNKLNPF